MKNNKVRFLRCKLGKRRKKRVVAALRNKEKTAAEKALELFESENGISFNELRDQSKKSKFMRYGGEPVNNNDNDLLKKASHYQKKFFEKE